jgi:hypothetical protein
MLKVFGLAVFLEDEVDLGVRPGPVVEFARPGREGVSPRRGGGRGRLGRGGRDRSDGQAEQGDWRGKN